MASSIRTDEALGQVQSLVRAFGILEELGKADGIKMTGLAQKVGLPLTTVHRLTTTLEALGYASVDRESGKWFPGRRAYTIGAAFLKSDDFLRLSQQIMRALVLEVQHSVNISVIDQSTLLFVSQVRANGNSATPARPGVRMPLYSTAAGKAMLAHWTRSELTAYLDKQCLVQRTEQTICSRVALFKELDRIREYGFAIDDEEQTTGHRCVAAAILDLEGRPKGAISIADSSRRLRKKRLCDVGPSLVGAAQRLTQDFAYAV